MKPADICIAVLVAMIWGLAFVASRIALDELSPTLMTALRFTIGASPCLIVPRPKVSWPVLISISFTLFLGQFLTQAYGIAHGVPVGLTSVLVQSQALFTIGFAAILFEERPSRMQTIGIAIAAVGLLMICGTVGYDFSVSAFAVLMLSPICFAAGNLLLRRAPGVPMFDLSAWLCLVAAVPLLVWRWSTMACSRPGTRCRTCRPVLLACSASASFPPARPIGYGDGYCVTIRRRRWCRSLYWCRLSVRPPPASSSMKPSGRFGWPACSPWSAALR